jgi:hypothetical protein
MAPAKILSLPRTIWPSCLSSLVACAIVCGGPPPTYPAEPSPHGTESRAHAGDLDQDAQSKLLRFLRAGQTLFVRRVLPEGDACVAVQPRPSLPNGWMGEVLVGDQRGAYTVHRGHWSIFRSGAAKDFAVAERWTLHGVSRDGVLVSGALMSTSRESCEADSTHRPLALFHDRCGDLRGLPRAGGAGATAMPWVFTREDPSTSCRLAGSYFAQGVRYPFEFFVPRGRLWLTGPLVGESGQPTVVTFKVEAGRLKLGSGLPILPGLPDIGPVIEPLPPTEAQPAMIETGASDFARDLLAEQRTLFIPLLRDGAESCAAADLSRLHGRVMLPSFSGQARALEFVKDEAGLEVWRADRITSNAKPAQRNLTIGRCRAGHVRLAVHGRDANTYHVGGSRWFFDRAECERHRGKVSPSLVDILNVTKDACGGADASLVARPGVAWRARTYSVREDTSSVCARLDVVAPAAGSRVPGQMLLHGPAASAERRFWFEAVAGGRFIWRSAWEGANPTEGELVEVRPRDHGLAVGKAIWFPDERSCNAAAVSNP